MRAVVIEDHGAAPRLRELPEPSPAPGEVKVHVRASSINGFDALLASGALEGMYEHRFPVVLGKDFAGTVTDVGDGVTDFAVGDEVFGVVAGKLPTDGGGFGEHLTTASSIGIAHIPIGLDHARAGVLGLAGAAAACAVDAIDPAPGEVVLVSGATGGVGMYVMQLLAQRNTRVIATAMPGIETRHVLALGADGVVDHRIGLANQVKELASGGVDAVVHLAGDGTALADLLTAGGRIASVLHLDPGQFAGRDITATAVMASPTRDVLDRLAADAVAGRLRMRIAHTYQIDEVSQALIHYANGTVGKLAIAVP